MGYFTPEKDASGEDVSTGRAEVDHESDIYKAPDNRKTIGLTSAVFL